MILKCLLIAAAVLLASVAAAVKIKKLRGLFIVLAVLAAVPTAGLGLIAMGQGQLLNYPGTPAAAVEGMVSALNAGEYEAADDYVFGSLGLVSEEELNGDRALIAPVCESLSVAAGEAEVNDFTAVLSVQLTGLDSDAWLTALAEETELALDEIVQSSNRKEVFNADGTAYLDGITERA